MLEEMEKRKQLPDPIMEETNSATRFNKVVARLEGSRVRTPMGEPTCRTIDCTWMQMKL